MELKDATDKMGADIASLQRMEARFKTLADKMDAFEQRPPIVITNRTADNVLLWIIGGLMVCISAFLIIRLGPEGYSLSDAKHDREAMCEAIERHVQMTNPGSWRCPWVEGESNVFRPPREKTIP